MVLKNVAIGLLCFILFLSLTIFGVTFLINRTALNPSFLGAELNRLDAPLVVEEVLSEQAPEEELSTELKTAIVDNVGRLEPLVKEQLSAAIYSVYDYLLGKRGRPELVLTLRNTFLSAEFVNSLIDELDIPPLARALINEQLPEDIPEEMEYLVEYSDEYLDEVIIENEPWLKEQISSVADPVFDYLLGQSATLDEEISLTPVLESLEDTMREPFLESPPSSLAYLPRSQLERHYEEHFEDLAAEISTFELDESVITPDVPADITTAIGDVEEVMEESRQYVSYFRLGYILLIVFMLLLIAGITLICRDVRCVSRSLGITFLVYGAIELAGILISKNITWNMLPLSDVPSSLEPWLYQFFSNFLSPLQWLSVGLIIIGVALTVVSFLYKRGET